jgi:predicted PurR-regulated permease PerM
MTDSQARGRDLRPDIVFAFALAAICFLAWLIRDVLVLLYVSALLAVVLRPVVAAVSRVQIGRWRPFRGYAILVLFLLVGGGLTIFGFLALPPVVRDLREFAKETPTRLPLVLQKLQHIPFADRINMDDVESRIQDSVSNAATYLVLSLKNWANAVFDTLMGFILTVYFIHEGDAAYSWGLSFVPVASRERLDRTLQSAKGRMGKWLFGQLLLMLILGVVSTIVFAELNVRYASALGVLTGLLNIIPVAGAAVSIALALLVAAIDSWGRVVGIIVFYLVWLQVENSFLIPRIMGNTVGLPALGILVALLIGSSLAGIVGAIVSVPTAVLVSILLDEYLVRRESGLAS